MGDATLDLLFVYGSLRSDCGHPMHGRLLGDARLVGRGWASGQLVRISWYPGLVKGRVVEAGCGGEVAAGDVDGNAGRVRGEVYRLAEPGRALAALDRYEGCGPESPQPREYRRIVDTIALDAGDRVRAWVYEYLGEAARGMVIASGDWLGAGGEGDGSGRRA